MKTDGIFADATFASFLRPSGVVVRPLECSFSVGGLRLRRQVEQCGAAERRSAGRMLAATVLRWDVPVALFGGGRTRLPTEAERRDPRLQGELCGCGGHRISSSAIGWIFDDVPTKRRGIGFPHDAWVVDASDTRGGPRCPRGTAPGDADSSQYVSRRFRLLQGRHSEPDFEHGCWGSFDWNQTLGLQTAWLKWVT